MSSLLGRRLDGYSENKKDLCEKEDDYRKDTDYFADDFIKCNGNGASDNAASKNRGTVYGISDHFGFCSGLPQKRQSLKC